MSEGKLLGLTVEFDMNFDVLENGMRTASEILGRVPALDLTNIELHATAEIEVYGVMSKYKSHHNVPCLCISWKTNAVSTEDVTRNYGPPQF